MKHTHKHRDFINWKTYYKPEQINDYSLRDTYCINLFNTNDTEMGGENQINYLNKHIGELVMLYYIWKNNLKSDYICISQYRRDLTYIDFDKLDEGKIQCLDLWFHGDDTTTKIKDRLLDRWDPMGYATEKLWSYLKKKYGYTDQSIEELKNRPLVATTPVFVWAMKWDKFCELCDFIFGYIDEMFPNDEWKNIDKLTLFQNKQKNAFYCLYPNENDFRVTNDRYIVHIVEEVLIVLLPIMFDVFNDNDIMYNTHIYTEIDDTVSYSDVTKFYYKNIKCNPSDIIVKCNDSKTFEKITEFFNQSWAKWEFYKIKIVNLEEKKPDNAFVLKVNEFFDVDYPLDLHQGKYNIKEIKA